MLWFTLVGSGVLVKGDIPPTQLNAGLQNAVFRREHVVRLSSCSLWENLFSLD